ncbi:DUF2278 family protein [Aneurinibacillus sp. Ricciae_BoGa-3]|uniref:DUF2278 family protein n=1 Tax=Aneurinibacillus sp. Ricciae_BoGa-3 TaxID=3022697 RepID=UPI002340F3FD|nr:DUF2278 family protein [Aneurinibacillus sp. Ricciae_BoGa-3]WCK54970.1 DUF2278 family protein [Aneurinibacillus sp. Ricciae_BoGa-3]
MALPLYSVFRGNGATIDNIQCETPKKGGNQTLSGGIVCKPDRKDTPHYRFTVKSASEDERGIEVIINVRSGDKRKSFSRNLYCYFTENFDPLHAKNFSFEKLKQLPPGLTVLDFDLESRKKSGIALDYVRSNLFNISPAHRLDAVFKELPTTQMNGKEEEVNDLNEFLHDQILKAKNGNADVYLFGDAYPHLPRGYKCPVGIPNEEERQIRLKFLRRRFLGLKGIHDIHMNQGNTLKEKWIENNAVYQDGALFIHYTNEDKWSAIFLRFASQSLNTDDQTGCCND